jgi:hypothetical protein
LNIRTTTASRHTSIGSFSNTGIAEQVAAHTISSIAGFSHPDR